VDCPQERKERKVGKEEEKRKRVIANFFKKLGQNHFSIKAIPNESRKKN